MPDRSLFWRAIDPGHPLYTEELAATQGNFIRDLYEKVDEAVGRALDRLDAKSWLMVMSDHGFTSFRRLPIDHPVNAFYEVRP